MHLTTSLRCHRCRRLTLVLVSFIAPFATGRERCCAPSYLIEHPLGTSETGFGSSVAALDDMLFVGAPWDASAGEFAGAVYVFQYRAGDWRMIQQLLPSSPDQQPRFGWAVAVNRTAPDVMLIGAPFDSEVGHNAGTAYVFRRTDGRWIESGRLHGKQPAENALFGAAIDFDGRTSIVGAPFEDTVAGGSVGSAYVFDHVSSARPGHPIRLAPPPNTAPDGARFGRTVAIANDQILVGAPYLGAQYYYGRAYFFRRTKSSWRFAQIAFAPLPLERDRFGWAVELAGSRAFLGAPRDTPPTYGSIALFRSNPPHVGTMPWDALQQIDAPDPTILDRFGASLSADRSRVVVGAWSHGEGGAAYVYSVNDNQLMLECQLVPKMPEPDADFGMSVAMIDDLVIVGAPKHDGKAEDVGGVYIYQIQRWSSIRRAPRVSER
jgi:hypothetical protein